jgi:ABC-type branched-subunit amino acid transport system ATPase component/ABC-type branched-subunit amino acid transport system permease subunit
MTDTVAPEAPPAQMATEPRGPAWWHRMLRPSDLAIVLGVAGALLLAPSYSQYRIVFAFVCAYTIVALGLVLLFGAGGQISLGQAMFFAVGAMTAGNLTSRTQLGLEAEIPLAILLGFVIGVLVGLPSLRVGGLYLAIATLALNFAGQQFLMEIPAISGGGAGLTSGPLRLFGSTLRDPMALVSVAIVLVGISMWITINLKTGRTGRGLNALRTSESAAAAIGAINLGRLKLVAFGISAAFASVGGVIYMHAIGYVNPQNFSIDLSIQFLLLVVIGGAHRSAGALIGAAFVLGMPEFFRDVQEYEGMIYGAILLVLVIFFPDGLVGIAERLGSLLGSVRSRVMPAKQREVVLPDDLAFAGASGATLRLDHVGVSFGGLRAVSDVSLELPPGQVLGLLGPNGAGKTTLFNAISGLVQADGAVRLDDTELTNLSVRSRARVGVGRTFQNLNLHEDRTVIEHLLLGMDRELRYHPLSEALRAPWVIRAEERIRISSLQLLAEMDLLQYAESTVADLPYGIQKRVDVARALATRPRLLLLDEPAAGLPTSEAAQMIDQVLQMTRRTGTTVVIIEHNVELVASVADRVVVLDAGSVIADGSPESAMNDPQVIAAYLGV